MRHLITKANFKLCDEASEIENPTVDFNLYEEDHPTDIEIDVLASLGANGSTHFPLFHEVREPCIMQRPVGDLLYIWHTEKIEGSVFCLHLYERFPEESGSEAVVNSPLRPATSESASNESSRLFVSDRSPSPPPLMRSLVKFRLTFGFKRNAPVNHDLWKSREVLIPVTDTVASIPLQISRLVEQIALDDISLTATLLGGSHQLFLRPTLQFPDERRFYTDFTRTVRIDIVDDLYPSNIGLTDVTPIQVKIKLRPTLEQPDDLAEAIIPDVKDNTDTFHRIGTLATITSPSPGQRRRLPFTRALIGRLEHDGEIDEEVLKLSAVDSWAINGLLIGETYAHQEPRAEKGFVLTGPYHGAAGVEELTARVQRHREDSPGEGSGCELPVAPMYCWRGFDEDWRYSFENPAARAVAHLAIAVRCVNMLPKHSGGSNIVLPAPENLQFEVNADDTAETIKEVIEEEFREEGEHEDERTTNRLFQPALSGKWRLLLWVLPQMDNQTTLFQYHSGSISRFLDPSKNDGRLYLEAHILPSSS